MSVEIGKHFSKCGNWSSMGQNSNFRECRELGKETSEEAWEQKNDALRRLGLRTIPNPGE